MKKRITGIMICLMLLCISVFSGCSLITLDRERYLNEVVASIEDKEDNHKINITKKDLISAYNSYGYYYTQYYGYSAAEALDKTVDLLINRKITIDEAERVYSEGLSEAEKTYLWQQTADSLENNFKSYLNKVLGISDSSKNESDARVFNGYTKNAELKNTDGNYEIVKTAPPSKAIENFKYDVPHDISKPEDKKLIYTNFVSFVNSAKADGYTKAFNNYLKELKANENGLRLSTDTVSVFTREIERLYTVNYENYMIEKYDEYFTNYSEVSTITVKQMLDLYTSMVRSSYTQYIIEEDSAYESNMQSDSSKIYYYKEGETETDFFQVAHVLFKFTDEQSAKYKDIQSKKKNGYYTDDASYNQAIADLCSELVPVVRVKNEDGEYQETQITSEYEKNAYSLARYIKSEVDSKATAIDKAEAFREFIYKYNDDPGMINAENNYTIGVNKSQAEEGKKYKTYSNYVTEFTNTAVELYNDGLGEIGDISEPVITENGMHILFYVGQLENLFKGIDHDFSLTNDEVDLETGLTPIEVLNSKRVNIFIDKTYFDVIYDSLVTDNFAVFQNLNMNELRKQYNLNTYPDAYKDLISN